MKLWLSTMYLLITVAMLWVACSGSNTTNLTVCSEETCTVGTAFVNNQILQTNTLAGTTTSTLITVDLVQVQIDGGAWVNATGTSTWTYKLPNMVDDGSTWATGSSHTVSIRSVSNSEGTLSTATFTLIKGINNDFNGDGYEDLVGGASGSDVTCSGCGIAYIYHGSSSSLPTTLSTTINYPSTDASAIFSVGVEAIGDVNGDGFADLAIGAWSSDINCVNCGSLWIYHGSSSGVSTTPIAELPYPDTDGVSIYSQELGAVGDVNGDGYDDLFTAAYFSDTDCANCGMVYGFYGTSTGLPTTPSLTISNPDAASTAFGFALVSGLDINKDGYAELIIGATGTGAGGTIFIHNGSSTGTSSSADITIASPDAGSNLFGYNISDAGDFNGDGNLDFAVGAPSYDGVCVGCGRVYTYLGTSNSINTTPNVTIDYPGADANASMGEELRIGDFNGDGYLDLITGAFLSDIDCADCGIAFVFHGSSSDLSTTANLTLSNPGADSFANFGGSFGAFDMNSDGYDDVVIGASSSDYHGANLGGVFFYTGSLTGLGSLITPVLPTYPEADTLSGFLKFY